MKLVVHCKYANYDVYIGRGQCPKTGAPGEWGNPFVMQSHTVEERRRVIDLYREWLLAQPELVQKAQRELRGKILGCWCAPQACHGDVLVTVANMPF
jgi:hypothetical protein